LKYLVSLEPIPIHQLPYGELDGVGSAREYAFLDLIVYPAEHIDFHPHASTYFGQVIAPLNFV